MNAIVIGGSKGIGSGLCERLRHDRHNVISMSRNPHGQNERWLDLAYPEARIVSEIRAALSRIPQLDLLVLSAGMGAMVGPAGETMELADRLMRTNFLGPQAVFRACLKPLLRADGRVVVIGSTAASHYGRGLSLYRASKAAAEAYFVNKSIELREKLEIHLIAPGWVDTPMTADLKPQVRERILQRIPAGRFATVDEVVSLVLGVLDQAHVTGYVPGIVHSMNDFTVE